MATAATTPTICVPLVTFDHQLGFLYAIGSGGSLDGGHFTLLEGVAAIAAMAFEHASYVELLQDRNSTLQQDLDLRHDLVGNSPVMADLSNLIARVAPANTTVLIQGDSGTGKGQVARASRLCRLCRLFRGNSKRASGPFVAVNCAALAESLLESQAVWPREGRFHGRCRSEERRVRTGLRRDLFPGPATLVLAKHPIHNDIVETVVRVSTTSMKVTLDLPDDLAADLQLFESQSATIIAAGLREIKSAGGGAFPGLAPVLEKLAELPTPQEVLDLRPSTELQKRISELLDKNRGAGLTPEENAEWQRYETVEHLVRMAKSRASAKLKSS